MMSISPSRLEKAWQSGMSSVTLKTQIAVPSFLTGSPLLPNRAWPVIQCAFPGTGKDGQKYELGLIWAGAAEVCEP